MHPRGDRRTAFALGLSLAVHGLLLVWVLGRPLPASPKAPQPVTRITWIDAVAPAASRPEPVQPVDPAPRAPGSPSPGGAPGTSAGEDPHATTVVTGADARGAATRAGSRTAEPSDLPREAKGAGDLPAPRATTLVPSDDVLGVPSGEGSTGGRTIYPSDLPGADEVLAEEEARVHARVDGWARQAIAAARVRGGLPEPAYGQLGEALREATAEVPKFIDTDSVAEVGRAVADSWKAGAERYGSTGAPYDEPEGRLEAIEKPSSLSAGASAGSPDAIALSQFFAAGARLQDFADGRTGAELYALVEIRQQGTGAVEAVTLLRPSGVVPFDRWVAAQAGAVAKGFLLDAGARATPYRSVWRFDGLVTFRRKLKLSELDGRAALGMMTMAALSALSGIGHSVPVGSGPVGTGPEGRGTAEPRDLGPRFAPFVGRFDELTGEVDMVDLTNPAYDCRVTLLEAD